MKKIDRRFLVVLMTTSLALGCMGCGSDKDDRKDDDRESKTEATENADEEEEETEAEVEETETEATEEPTTATESIASIEIGDTVSNDTVEYTLTNVEFVDELIPPNPPAYYTYFPGHDGETIMVVEVDVKNISTTTIGSDFYLDCFTLYDGTYEYPATDGGFVWIDNEGDFEYYNFSLTALSTEHTYFFYYLPDEVVESDAPLEVYITLYGGGEYLYTIR